jgi:hypothetical protein
MTSTASYKVEKKTLPTSTFGDLMPGEVFAFSGDNQKTYHVKLDSGSYTPLNKIGLLFSAETSLRYLVTTASQTAPVTVPVSISIVIGEA